MKSKYISLIECFEEEESKVFWIAKLNCCNAEKGFLLWYFKL